MSRTKKILLGTVAAVGIGAAALSFSGVGGQTMNTAKLELIGSAAAAGGRHGWSRHGGRGGHGGICRLCSPSRGEKLENAIGFAEAFFSFNAEQKTAWDGLTAALRDSSATIGEKCEALKSGERPKSATARLERVETMLTAGLDVVKKVRPAFDGFYATLNDDQKAALDKLIEHRRHGRR
jgi:hypothetical protein